MLSPATKPPSTFPISEASCGADDGWTTVVSTGGTVAVVCSGDVVAASTGGSGDSGCG